MNSTVACEDVIRLSVLNLHGPCSRPDFNIKVRAIDSPHHVTKLLMWPPSERGHISKQFVTRRNSIEECDTWAAIQTKGANQSHTSEQRIQMVPLVFAHAYEVLAHRQMNLAAKMWPIDLKRYGLKTIWSS